MWILLNNQNRCLARRSFVSYAYSSARTMRHRVAFSMANFVRPFLPAIRPMALDKLSPFNGLTRKRKWIERNVGLSFYHRWSRMTRERDRQDESKPAHRRLQNQARRLWRNRLKRYATIRKLLVAILLSDQLFAVLECLPFDRMSWFPRSVFWDWTVFVNEGIPPRVSRSSSIGLSKVCNDEQGWWPYGNRRFAPK